MPNKTISWEITSEEKKLRAKLLFFRVLIFSTIILLAIYIYSFFQYYREDPTFVAELGIVRIFFNFVILPLVISLGLSLIIYLIKYFASRNSHSYILTEEGIQITKGNLTKHFAWEEFQSFFGNSFTDEEYYKNKHVRYYGGNVSATAAMAASAAQPVMKIIAEDEVEKIGETLFLKLKRKGFWQKLYQVFIAVNLEPDSRIEAREFIKSKVKEKADKDGSMTLSVYRYK